MYIIPDDYLGSTPGNFNKLTTGLREFDRCRIRFQQVTMRGANALETRYTDRASCRVRKLISKVSSVTLPKGVRARDSSKINFVLIEYCASSILLQ